MNEAPGKAPAPIGWERVDANEGIVAVLELLHPKVALELADDLYVGATEGTTGALLAEAGDELTVRSYGNNVALVEHRESGRSALVQLSQLVACRPRRWSSGA